MKRFLKMLSFTLSMLLLVSCGTAPAETQNDETIAAETEAPETEAPETEAPETETPETEAPETEAPETCKELNMTERLN